MFGRNVSILAGAILATLISIEVMAQSTPINTSPPIIFSADEVVQDRELGIVRASGNVEISRDDRVLIADSVSYNQRTDVVTASGNVKFLDTSGDVLFAEFMEVTGDFRDGIVRDLRILLSDNARIAAAGARRSGGTRLEMQNAAYTPCESCANQPDAPPLWQIKARKVVHDQPNQTIEYSDAWMEFLGVPVAYTPYFAHPDPTVKRRRGFLTPSLGSSTRLGTTLTTPYFLPVNPSRDFTITPTLTTKERLHLTGEYRERFSSGEALTIASATYDSDDQFRGHVDADFRFDLNDTWRTGAEIYRATDDTYLRRYNFSSPSTLTSRAYVEGFRQRNYAAVNAYTFQGLQVDDDPGNTPLVLPQLEFQHVGEAGKFGAYTTVDASTLSLYRSEGTDVQRLSVKGGWHIPFRTDLGDIYDVSLTLRGDAYHTNDLSPDSNDDTDGFAGRVYPQLQVDWRYPWSRQDGNISQLIEPVASVSVSPYGGNSSDIPNEDSIDVEFDDTNLLTASRFSGIDRVDGGPRVSYGLKWGVVGSKGGATSAFIGQSYRLRTDSTFKSGSGLEDNLSDIVARLDVTPRELIDLSYRTRLDKDNFAPRRNELQFSAGPDALRVNANYTFFASSEDDEFEGREQFSGGATAKLSRFWRSRVSTIYDLENDDLRNIALGFTYECECFTFDVALRRTFFVDRDLRPDDSILVRLSFKTLGDVATGLSGLGG